MRVTIVADSNGDIKDLYRSWIAQHPKILSNDIKVVQASGHNLSKIVAYCMDKGYEIPLIIAGNIVESGRQAFRQIRKEYPMIPIAMVGESDFAPDGVEVNHYIPMRELIPVTNTEYHYAFKVLDDIIDKSI